ncbi:MAG: hypothetical protein U0694_00320 [Anaerolineae bacterium]
MPIARGWGTGRLQVTLVSSAPTACSRSSIRARMTR